MQYSIFMYEKFFVLIIQVVTTYMIMKKKKIIFIYNKCIIIAR